MAVAAAGGGAGDKRITIALKPSAVPERTCSDLAALSPLSLLFGSTPTLLETQDLAMMGFASPSFQVGGWGHGSDCVLVILKV